MYKNDRVSMPRTSSTVIIIIVSIVIHGESKESKLGCTVLLPLIRVCIVLPVPATVEKRCRRDVGARIWALLSAWYLTLSGFNFFLLQ